MAMPDEHPGNDGNGSPARQRPRRHTPMAAGKTFAHVMQLHYVLRLEVGMIVSSVTDRFQTTIPKGVRDALGIRRGDTVSYEVADGYVVLKRWTEEAVDDPALAGFLDLLERDIAAYPGRLQPVPESSVGRALDLIRGVEVDLDAPL